MKTNVILCIKFLLLKSFLLFAHDKYRLKHLFWHLSFCVLFLFWFLFIMSLSLWVCSFVLLCVCIFFILFFISFVYSYIYFITPRGKNLYVVSLRSSSFLCLFSLILLSLLCSCYFYFLLCLFASFLSHPISLIRLGFHWKHWKTKIGSSKQHIFIPDSYETLFFLINILSLKTLQDWAKHQS